MEQAQGILDPGLVEDAPQLLGQLQGLAIGLRRL